MDYRTLDTSVILMNFLFGTTLMFHNYLAFSILDTPLYNLRNAFGIDIPTDICISLSYGQNNYIAINVAAYRVLPVIISVRQPLPP